MDEAPAWSDLIETPGCLTVRYRREHSHALSFRFFGDDDDEWEIQADVKWDGCVNWETNPECLYHFCDQDDIQRLSKTFDLAWEITRTKLDTADDACFEKIGRR